ncbi:translocation/assembly module TamB [Aureispira anguillae]|uniref:Translocation/assembly module TamB n=1 Tax=Aureispira anguillae TaxID=2864201 RepID=A0A915YMB1_9BACT|nr:translocation/assembly module TamB [Aureispira anguillae]BDS15423.1 translocation/assembly module TamB [Aureispira anguillae]
MSKAWDTTVSIERVEIKPLSNFKFHHFFIQDHDQDTLIYAKYAEAQSYNVFALFKKEIDIGKVIVKDAVFKVQRRPEAEFFNIHFLIAFFESGERKVTQPKKFKLNFGGAELVNARIHLADTAIGTSALITCDTGYVHKHATQGVDMIGKKVWGEIAHLSRANITVRLFDKVEIPNVDSSFWETPIDSTIPYWDVGCEKFLLNDVNFRLINERTNTQIDTTRALDFANLNFENINLDVDTFRLQKEVFTGKVRQLHGLNHGGFELKRFSGDALISPTKVAISHFNLETNTSKIGHALILKYSRYRDFYEFPDKVKILGTFDSSTVVTFRDIAAFAPPIKNNVFIESNLDHPIYLKGKFRGTVNNFRAKDVDIKVHNSHIVGNLSMNDITIPDAAFIDLNLKKVNTDYHDLKQIIPFVKLPPNIETLGTINFEGSYTGFFQDFVAYGQLDTELGRINSDLQLNLRRGKTEAAYKGGFKFNNFDIGTFINNKDVGNLTIQSNVKGTGLTLETLDAALQNAKIDSFTFKQYQYKDIAIDGRFKQKKFDGDIISKDTNMYVFVRGIMDLNGALPSVDILGNVKNIDFQKLNLSQESIGLHLDTFDINARGSNIDNFTGDLSIRGIKGHREEIYSSLKSISVKAKNIPTDSSYNLVDGDSVLHVKNIRSINLKSDIIDVNVYGKYDVVNLIGSMENFIKINHPNLYRELNRTQIIEVEDNRPLEQVVREVGENTIDTIPHQDFNIVINIPKNTKNITQLINKNFKSLEGIFLTGEYDGSEGYLELDGEVGLVHIGDIEIENINISNGKAIGPTFDLVSSVEALKIKGNSFIPNIKLTLDAIGDSVLFKANADAVGEIAQALSINGKLEIKEKLVILKLDTSSLTILNEKWTINDSNHVKIGDKVLDIQNVVLSSDNKRVEISSINENKGAKVELENISLGWLYGMMKPLPKIDIKGIFSGEASMNNVFNQKGIAANILIDTLIINDDYWGSNSRLIASADSLKSTFKGQFTHSSDFVDSLYLTANFTPTFATNKKSLQNLLDIHVTAEGAKAKILEYFLKEQISETEGNAFAQARVFGNINGKNTIMNIEGDGLMTGVKTKVNFLQTKYILSDGKIKIDNKGFHIDPALKLKNGNERDAGGVAVIVEGEPFDTAYIGGSLVHDHLKGFGLDVIAVLDNNLAMKTTLEDNNTFYGTVYASGTASFTGPFERLKLKVDATTEANTEFNLPVGGPLEVTQTNYITFVDKKATVDSTKVTSIKDQILSGLDIEIIADIKPSAIARLIIDEKAGDIIEGRGQSDNMRIHYSPTGDLKIFGTYVIEEGNYLFTYKNIINKPFEVQKGGTITWGDNDGDPYKAQLDIKAAYVKNLGVSNLIKSYTTGNPELSSLANTPCKVSLLMGLKGELFSPEIDFKIDIDDVPSSLQNPVSLALRTIHSDKNKLNRQVFGIIALQQFLPLENAGDVNVVSSGISTGISTVSELFSQQLSLYINDLLAGVIKDVDFISSLEFDFNFNIRDSDNQTVRSTTSNVRVGSDVKFLDDRLRFYAGANMDIASDNPVTDNSNGSGYIGGDFILEYNITNDGKLKVKAYNRTESTILGRSTRTGIGISYRKEFNTLQELIDEAKKNRKKNKRDRYTNRVKKLNTKLLAIEEDIKKATKPSLQLRLNKKKEKLLSKLHEAETDLEGLPPK